jgi:FkbM family methyltransferase
MDCGYFLLTKRAGDAVDDAATNEIVCPRGGRAYLLPRTNLVYYAERGLFEGWLIEWSRQLVSATQTFLDIGAHTGTYAVSLAPHAKEVVAFEPQRGTFYALCGSVALSQLANVECVRVALGSPAQAATGYTTLSICSQDGGGSSVCLPASTSVLREERVEVRTLDSYSLENVGFIKMDVEGNELSVLKGARETIARCGRPKVLFESNGGEDPELFGFFLTDLGYSKVVPIRGVANMFLAE